MEWLTDERYTWRIEMEYGCWHEPHILKQYREHRDSNLWRATREVEKLCEYILHLEGAKPMSEFIKVVCDNCSADISCTHDYPTYRLRLIEEMRREEDPAVASSNLPELDSMKNFCNKVCLTQWISK